MHRGTSAHRGRAAPIDETTAASSRGVTVVVVVMVVVVVVVVVLVVVVVVVVTVVVANGIVVAVGNGVHVSGNGTVWVGVTVVVSHPVAVFACRAPVRRVVICRRGASPGPVAGKKVGRCFD